MVDINAMKRRWVSELTTRYPTSIIDEDGHVWILQIDRNTQATVEFNYPPTFRIITQDPEYLLPVVRVEFRTNLMFSVIHEIDIHIFWATQTVEPPPPHKPRTNLSTHQLAVGDVVWVPVGYKATEAIIEDVAFEPACTTVTAKVRCIGRMELDTENIFADQELCLRDMYEYFLSGQEAVRRQLDLL